MRKSKELPEALGHDDRNELSDMIFPENEEEDKEESEWEEDASSEAMTSYEDNEFQNSIQPPS